MIDRFRASGLSHLTAVSGQNVSFLLAAVGPLLVRLRPVSRWMVTLGLIVLTALILTRSSLRVRQVEYGVASAAE